MCPKTLLLYAAILVTGAVAIITRRRLSEVISANCDRLSQLLNNFSREHSFTREVLSGYYHGRKVTFLCDYFKKGEKREFFIEPVNIPLPQKRFLLDYPRPTANTKWKGKKVFYSPAGLWKRVSGSYYKLFTPDEFSAILRELTEAAIWVEKGTSINGADSYRVISGDHRS